MKVVASKVKELLNQKGLMCAGDLIEALDKHLSEVLTKAAWRCEQNGRKTVRPADL
jgi:histone H3/H4